jgi:phage antirepressor YoqD-like protein
MIKTQQKMQVAALFAQGKSPKEIAKVTKLDEEEIKAFLIERGKIPSEEGKAPEPAAEKAWKDMTEDERMVAIDEYNNGMGTYDLAAKYHTDRMKLVTWLKEHDVVMRGRGPSPQTIEKMKAKTKAAKAANAKENPANAEITTIEEELATHKNLPHSIDRVVSDFQMAPDYEALIKGIYNTMKRAAEALSDAFSVVDAPRKSSIYAGEAYGRLHEQIVAIEKAMHWEE